MIYLSRAFDFEAAHKLDNYDGACADLHGHTYFGEVTISGAPVGSTGMVLDFTVLKNIVKEVIARYDHKYLNDIMKTVPTAENIASQLFLDFDMALALHEVWVYEIVLHETRDSKVTIRRS